MRHTKVLVKNQLSVLEYVLQLTLQLFFCLFNMISLTSFNSCFLDVT